MLRCGVKESERIGIIKKINKYDHIISSSKIIIAEILLDSGDECKISWSSAPDFPYSTEKCNDIFDDAWKTEVDDNVQIYSKDELEYFVRLK